MPKKRQDNSQFLSALAMDRIMKRSKAFSVSAVMKNKEISKLIGDAINAPLGSTKRQQASKMLKSINKARVRFDGIGGMPYPDGKGGNGVSPLVPPPDPTQLTVQEGEAGEVEPVDTSRRFKIIQGEPTPAHRQEFPLGISPAGEVVPPQGTTSVPDQTALTVRTDPDSSTPVIVDRAEKTGNFLIDLFGGIGNLTKERQQQYTLFNDVSVINTQTGKREPRYEITSDGRMRDKMSTEGFIPTADGGVASEPPPARIEDSAEQSFLDFTQPPAIPLPSLALQTPPESTTPAVHPSLGAQPGAGTRFPSPEELTPPGEPPKIQEEAEAARAELDDSGIVDETMVDVVPEIQNWYDDWFYNQLDSTGQQQFQDLYDAVRMGIGPSTFAYMMLTDKEKLKNLFPNVPEQALPMGGSLSRQVNEIEKRLREEHDLTRIEEDMRRVQNRGRSLVPTLQNYIRGRDTYLNKVEDMIDDTESKLLNMDTGNPMIAKSMSDYMNYLYVLKGRQNQRYIDFLNTGITEHNNELQIMQSDYESAFSRYQTELAQKTAVTTEEYGRWRELLTEMYTNLEGQEERMYSNAILKEQAAQAHLKTLTDTAKATGVSTNASFLEEKDAYFDIIGGVGTDVVGASGEEGSTPIKSSIDEMINLAQLNPDKTNAEGVLYWLSNYYIPTDASNLMATGNIQDVHDIYGNLVLRHAFESTRPNARAEASTIGKHLANTMASSFYKYLTEDEQGIVGVEAVLKDLTGTSGWSGNPNYGMDDKAEFINNNKDEGVPTDIMSELFDSYVKNVYEGRADPRNLYNFNQSSDDLANDVTRDLHEYWVSLYGLF